VRPRTLALAGIDHPMVLTYPEALLGRKPVGRRVAIIGAGGIGFDMAEFLLGKSHVPPELEAFSREYGLDVTMQSRGGLRAPDPVPASMHQITLLQRKQKRVGGGLAPTTGWIRRDKLARHGVEMLAGADYQAIDDDGLHIIVEGQPRLIPADTVIICAGQESERTLYNQLRETAPALPVHVIGGADQAVELDAMRAIDQATRLAVSI
jgi:2,4-dienoyl-CoA reductase (NADPH2)